MSEFKRTVNLRDGLKRHSTNAAHPNENLKAEEKARREALQSKRSSKAEAKDESRTAAATPPARKKTLRRVEKKPNRDKARAIDHVFNDDEDIKPRKEYQTIEFPSVSRPKKEKSPSRQAVIGAFLAIILAFLGWQFFFADNEPVVSVEPKWYMVKLSNNETYYGLIADTAADPIVIKSVYYNYDQLNPENQGGEPQETGNLRLVKRGKETHGPDGTLRVVRSQVMFMEPLKEDSKVLNAILEYEK